MENYEKAYKEALERMKSWARGEHPECFSEARKAAEFIFPELAESEDEMIRKELIKYLPYCDDISKDTKERWIAWLGKEHKPISLSQEDIANIDNIIWLCENSEKGIETTWIPTQAREIKKLMENYQTTQGVVKLLKGIQLTSGETIWLCEQVDKLFEKQGEQTIPKNIDDAALQYVDTCAVDGEVTHGNITEPYWNNHSMMNAYKAGWLEKQGESYTKKDVDNAWLKGICDAKRELEKQSAISLIHSNSSNIGKDEQKPAWSEEDEKMREKLLFLMEEENSIEYWEGCYEWLKSFKDRLKGE